MPGKTIPSLSNVLLSGIADAHAVRCPACGAEMDPAPLRAEFGRQLGEIQRAPDRRRGRSLQGQPYYCKGCNAWLHPAEEVESAVYFGRSSPPIAGRRDR